MSAKPDGGPAFPLFFPESKTREGKVTRARDEHPGMSLRDWFAGQALNGILAADDMVTESRRRADIAATWAYEYADAMLKVRQA